MPNERQKAISAQATSLAEKDERYKEIVESSHRVEMGLKDELARLHAIQFQPRLRFVANRRSFGTEECDALEIWNDGAAIDLQSLHQASYIELSFAIDPTSPDAGAQFAAMADGRYGEGFREIEGSVLEDRINLNHMQELIRHPTNPWGVENNAEYTVSLQDEWDIKYLENVWDQVMIPSIKRLGIARKLAPKAAAFNFVAPDEKPPKHPHIRYIPSYYFHRRD